MGNLENSERIRSPDFDGITQLPCLVASSMNLGGNEVSQRPDIILE